MNENEQSLAVSSRRIWAVILVMLVLLFLGPFKIEIRLSTYHYPLTSLSDFTIWSWTWVYSIVGYGATGFISRPFYEIFQYAILQTFLQFIFLGFLAGYQLGLVSMKDARNVGYASLFPGLLVLGVNLLLFLVPGSTNIIAPLPIPLVSILGILMLRLRPIQQTPDTWLSKE